MTKTIFITGATSGIGLASVKRFASQGWRVLFCGRRSERIATLQSEFDSQGYQTFGFVLDVRKEREVSEAISNLPEAWKSIDVLVNNAGLAAGKDAIDEGKLDDWERMIDTNVKGLLYVSRAIIPGMKEAKAGHIINVCSTAGHEVYPGGNVYCATKHAVDALTGSMRIDLLPHHIKVGQVSPGMVETEFSLVRFHGNQNVADAVYQGMDPLTAEDIADAIFYMATAPAHVNVGEMLLLPSAQANSTTVRRN